MHGENESPDTGAPPSSTHLHPTVGNKEQHKAKSERDDFCRNDVSREDRDEGGKENRIERSMDDVSSRLGTGEIDKTVEL